jgi:hypothetical protein
MSKRVVIALLLSVFLLQVVSASISFSSPQELYNIGDQLDLNVTLQPSQMYNGFFTAALKCGTKEVEIYRMPYDSTSGQFTTFNIKATLDKSLIGSLQGTCIVEGRYGTEKASSNVFELSSEIVVTLDVQGNIFEPADSISVSGTASLRNGKPINGEAALEVNKINLSYTMPVSDGKFSYTFTLPQDTASGGYIVSVTATNRDNLGNTLNSGNTSESFKVKQVVQAMEVALSNISVNPGSEILYQVVLYDQVLIQTTQEVAVKLLNPQGEVVGEKTVSSGLDSNAFSIGNSYVPGTWKVQAEINGLISEKTFNVEELKNITVIKENSTILVINTGNVAYTDPLKIMIGEKEEEVPLNLQVGEEKRLKIFAPDGDYDLSIASGSQQMALGRTFLTGNAIRVSDPAEVDVARFKVIFWIVLLIILAIFAYRMYRKFRRNREFISPSSSSAPIISRKAIKESKSSETFMWKSTAPAAVKETRSFSDAQRQNTLMKTEDFGKKEECSVVALKVKNYDEITKYKGTESAMDSLVRAAGLARSAKAQVSREDGFTVMIFSATATSDKNPHLKAVSVAKEMENLLKAHNRKYSRKISFGIGVATGEMIVEKRNGSVFHTPVGTLTATAKKIASHAYESLLIHDSTHNKLRGQIKSEKGVGGMHWTVSSIVSREQHNQFIKKFMERRADESKSF